MAQVPLTRPEAPVVTAQPWPTPSVAVMGSLQSDLASALLETWSARRLEVVLRHAAGFEWSELPDGARLTAHPEALEQAIREFEPKTPVVGVGPGFAVSVQADQVVYAGSLQSMLGLEAPLREVVRRATLHLERPRLEALRAMGRRLQQRAEDASLATPAGG